MPLNRPFQPTLKWHLTVLAVILVLLGAGFFIMRAVTQKLPPPYEPKRPAAQTTPWLNQ